MMQQNPRCERLILRRADYFSGGRMRGNSVLLLSVVLACTGLLMVFLGFSTVLGFGSGEPVPQPWLIVPGVILGTIAVLMTLAATVFKAPG